MQAATWPLGHGTIAAHSWCARWKSLLPRSCRRQDSNLQLAGSRPASSHQLGYVGMGTAVWPDQARSGSVPTTGIEPATHRVWAGVLYQVWDTSALAVPEHHRQHCGPVKCSHERGRTSTFRLTVGRSAIELRGIIGHFRAGGRTGEARSAHYCASGKGLRRGSRI